MDFFDVLVALLPPYGTSTRRARSREEELANNLVLFVLPAIDVCLLLFAGLGKHPGVAVMLLPGVFAAAGWLVSRALRMTVARSLALALGCGALCAFWGICAAFVSALLFTF